MLSDILRYLSLGLVVIWTVRLARSKGKNPLIWGGVSLGLMLIPGLPDIVGMGPMLFLLFLRPPQPAEQDVSADPVNCPKCRALHSPGHTYCVNCGWELSRPYHEETPTFTEGMAPPLAKTEEPTLTVAEANITGEAIGSSVSTAEEPPANMPGELEVAGLEVDAGSGPSIEEPPAEETTAETTTIPDVESEPPGQMEAPKPAFSRPLSANSLTERGLALFNQGKIQEAIDQFTKAIAVDPQHLPAWVQRAEAYAKQGFSEKSEADRRHLESLQGPASA